MKLTNNLTNNKSKRNIIDTLISNNNKLKNQISRNAKIKFQEMRKSDANETNINQTDFIYNQSIKGRIS